MWDYFSFPFSTEYLVLRCESASDTIPDLKLIKRLLR